MTPVQERALLVLDDLLAFAQQFEREELKIGVMARIADALWDFDEPRARHLFEEVFRAVVSADTAANQADQSHHARFELLGLISRRDPDLAEALTHPVPEAPAATDGKQADLQLQMASSIVASDPDRAARLAISSLDDGRLLIAAALSGMI